MIPREPTHIQFARADIPGKPELGMMQVLTAYLSLPVLPCFNTSLLIVGNAFASQCRSYINSVPLSNVTSQSFRVTAILLKGLLQILIYPHCSFIYISQSSSVGASRAKKTSTLISCKMLCQNVRDIRVTDNYLHRLHNIQVQRQRQRRISSKQLLPRTIRL